jgi:phosphatidylinositol glycan class V
MEQVPNFLLALPVLGACMWGCVDGWRAVLREQRQVTSTSTSTIKSGKTTSSECGKAPTPPSAVDNVQRHPVFIPLLVIHTLTTFVLIFSSHVQISLRVVQTMPLMWVTVGQWTSPSSGSAKQRTWRGTLGRWWIRWTVIWQLVSLVLWSSFLPPA